MLKCTMMLGDCLDVMPTIPKTADFIFADIPYGVLNAAWDKRIDLSRLWAAFDVTRKPNAAVCLMGTQPYVTELISSNKTNFSYDLIWIKGRGTGAFQARRRPLRAHEYLLVFFAAKATYTPQMRAAERSRRGVINKPSYPDSVFGPISASSYVYGDLVFPLSWFKAEPEHARRKIHSTQKPPSLLDWLIRTYSNEGDKVLDPTSGSGTTAVAALSCGRNVTCIEKDDGYFDASVERVRKHVRDNFIRAEIEVVR